MKNKLYSKKLFKKQKAVPFIFHFKKKVAAGTSMEMKFTIYDLD